MKRNGFHGPSSSHGPHGPLFSSSLRSFVIKLFLPFLLVVWCVLFMYLKYEPHAPEFSSQDPSFSANKNGRGNRKFGTLFERVQGSASLSAPSQFKRLIVVPGHAVMNLEYLSVADSQDEAWYLLSYQRVLKCVHYLHIVSLFPCAGNWISVDYLTAHSHRCSTRPRKLHPPSV